LRFAVRVMDEARLVGRTALVERLLQSNQHEAGVAVRETRQATMRRA